MKRRDYARRIINPYLDFKQTILKAYHCGRAARNAAKFTGSHNSIKLKLCCLAFLRELNGDRGRDPTAALKLFWPELFTAEAYRGFAPTLQTPNPQS